MKVLLKPFSNDIFKRNCVFNISDGTNIFFRFKDKLRRKGIEIDTLDLGNGKKDDLIVVCDIPYFWELDYWEKIIFTRSKKILFCFESPPVNPFSHRKFFFHFFDRVYTWNERLIDGKRIRKFNLPVLSTNLKIKEVPFKKKKLICLINANKSVPFFFWILSPFKIDLYKKREEVVDFLENKVRNSFDLYGPGWNEPKKFSLREKIFGYKKHLSYRGIVKKNVNGKVKKLSNYKFNICFENCVADGYISEKIIDCLKAHTVPVYFGSPNIKKYFPEKCFIDFRKFNNLNSLLDFIENMSEKKYDSYIENGNKLLKDKNFRKDWFEEGFEEKFLESIDFS